MKLAWFARVDWGSEKHQVCVLDAAGKVLGEREFEHSGTGLSQMASWVLSLATGDAGEVGVAVETPRGPVVESLMERGFAVHSLPETLIMAAEQVEAVQPEGAGVEEVVADKGYHSDETLVGLGEVGVRSHVSEPERGRRCWQDKKTGETPPEKRAAQKALYANRRRVRGRRGRRLQRRRGEVVERTFAHMYETGGMRRVWVRGHDNVRKRVLLQAAACNIGLLLRRQTGVGTPRSLQGRALSAI